MEEAAAAVVQPGFIDKFFKLNDVVNGIVWGPWMLCLLVGTGVYLTIVLGFPQLRYFRITWKEVFGKNSVEAKGDKSISSFAAMATAMAATVGTGNIAGVATAIHLGGPGAAFWMLVSAFFGMCTKFSEVSLAVHFREKDEHGDWRGGTMHILEKGAGHKWLAVIFALFAFLASFGIGAAVQASESASGLKMGFGINPLHSGIILAVLVGLVIIGGLKSLSTVTTYLVPFMAVFYVVGSMVVLIINAVYIPEAIGMIVKHAFEDPMAIPGALAGWTVREAVTKGIARGVFSNEAGLGSAPMVHATANVDHPARQGLYGIFEVFMDTMVICSMTVLVIMTTRSLTGEGLPEALKWAAGLSGEEIELQSAGLPEASKWSAYLSGAQLSLFAFRQGLGQAGTYILSIGLVLFAFTTILGWYWYAETAVVYLFGVWFKPVMKVLWIILILIGAGGTDLLMKAGLVEAGEAARATSALFLKNLWSLADTLNGLMAIPNLIGLLLLSGALRAIVKDFDAKRKSGEIEL